MGKVFKYWIIVFAMAGFSLGVYSQMAQQGPPEPQMEHGTGNAGPCGKGNGGGNGPSIPPPVGLCLPINDYLLPLFMSGIVLGGFMVWRLEGRAKPDECLEGH